MLGGSFRLLARALVPRAGGWKQTVLLLILPLSAVSCGSSGNGAETTATRVVHGPGFRFTAPADWKVAGTATSASARPSAGSSTLVSADVYRLGKTYSPDEFGAAARELDGVAARLARAAGGEVTSSETTTVAGRKIRAYRFTAKPAGGDSLDDRVGFLLVGKREVQLLCQAPSGGGDPEGSCALLFDTFSLTDGR
jgi:hypothetical protein